MCVPHQVIVDLAVIDYDDPAALARQRSFKVHDTKAGQAVPVLDDDRGRSSVCEQARELAATSVHPRTDLGHYLGDAHALSSGPSGHTGNLPVEVCPLVMR